MLNNVQILKGYKLHSLDGEIGTVNEFYFDDRRWTIRYLIANTGNWLTGRQVLIPPHVLTEVNKEEKYIAVDLTKKQIEDSPPMGHDKPVSRQFEEAYYGYYGWPYYWDGEQLWGSDPQTGPNRLARRESNRIEKGRDPHLQNTQSVTGYHIEATDGEIGHVEDFIIDDASWEIRYLVVDTKNWWPGKKVLIAPLQIERVSWAQSMVRVKMLRSAIQELPEYTEEFWLLREEMALYQRHHPMADWVTNQ